MSENGPGETESHQPSEQAHQLAAELLDNHRPSYTQHRRILSAIVRLLAADVTAPEIVRAVDTLHRLGPLNDAETSRSALLAYRLEHLEPDDIEANQLDPVLHEPADTYWQRHQRHDAWGVPIEPGRPLRTTGEPTGNSVTSSELDLTIRDPDIAAIIRAELAKPVTA